MSHLGTMIGLLPEVSHHPREAMMRPRAAWSPTARAAVGEECEDDDGNGDSETRSERRGAARGGRCGEGGHGHLSLLCCGREPCARVSRVMLKTQGVAMLASGTTNRGRGR